MFVIKEMFTHKKPIRHILSLALLTILGIGSVDGLAANRGDVQHSEEDYEVSDDIHDMFF